MKIVILATVYEYGGVSKIIKSLLDNLDRRMFQIVFIVESLASRHYPVHKDIKFINLDIKPARAERQKLFNMFRHLYRIRRVIISEASDIVISFTFPANCLYLLAFLWPVKKRPRLILTEYTEQLFVKIKPDTFKEFIFRLIYKTVMFLLYHKADAVVSVSKSISRYIERFLLMDRKRIKVIPVPADIREIRILSQEQIPAGNNRLDNLPCVGTVSRLSAEKGVNYLIEAFSLLVKKIDSRLIIIGDGKERGSLEKMAVDLGIRDKVDFLGWQENPYSYLKKMNVFVLSSLWEGFPSVIIESMVCGVPVVATRSVGGVEEAIRDGVDGILVPSRDTKAISESIYRLLKDREFRNSLIREADKKIGRFDSRKILKEYESVILGALHK